MNKDWRIEETRGKTHYRLTSLRGNWVTLERRNADGLTEVPFPVELLLEFARRWAVSSFARMLRVELHPEKVDVSGE